MGGIADQKHASIEPGAILYLMKRPEPRFARSRQGGTERRLPVFELASGGVLSGAVRAEPCAMATRLTPRPCPSG